MEWPHGFQIQQVQLYSLHGFIYTRSLQSPDHLICYYEHEIRCQAKLVINDQTGQAWLPTNHSHSRPSTGFLKELDKADNYNIIQLSHELVSCRTTLHVHSNDLSECKYCHKTFHDFDLYQRHVRRHEMHYVPYWMSSHNSSKYRTTKTGTKQPAEHPVLFMCQYCLHVFPCAATLRQHDNLHPYHCNICNVCFLSTASYLGHKHSRLIQNRNLLSRYIHARPASNRTRPISTVVKSSKGASNNRPTGTIMKSSMGALNNKPTGTVMKSSKGASNNRPTGAIKKSSKGASNNKPTGTLMKSSKGKSSKDGSSGKMESKLDNSKQLDNDNYFSCKHCTRGYLSMETLLAHNTEYPLFCTICQTCLPSVSEFLKHETIHKRFAKKKSFAKKCTFCGVQFVSSNQMINHVCSEPSLDKFHVDAKKTYKCKDCALVCQSYKQLITHATYRCKKTCKPTKGRGKKGSSRGRPIKKYFCIRCRDTFATKGELSDHSNTHKLEHRCSMCPEFFYSETELSQHVTDSHTCTYCEKQGVGKLVFTRTHFLQIHIRRYHQVFCPHCKQEFTSQKLVFEHVLSDHKCKYCKYNYLPSKEELIKHLYQMHFVQLQYE